MTLVESLTLHCDPHGTYRLSDCIASRHHLLLSIRHLRQRNLHSQVSTSHHNTIGLLEDLVEMLQGTRSLDLTDDQRQRLIGGPSQLLGTIGNVGSDLTHTLRCLHETRRDVVNVHRHAVENVGLVLVAHGGQVAGVSQRKVDTRTTAQITRVVDCALDLFTHTRHGERNGTVVEEDLHTRRQTTLETGIVNVQLLLSPILLLRRIVRQRNRLSLLQMNGVVSTRIVRQLARPDLRALCVQQNSPQLLDERLRSRQVRRTQLDFFLGGVREIEAHDLHTGLGDELEGFGLFGGRSDRRDDLGQLSILRGGIWEDEARRLQSPALTAGQDGTQGGETQHGRLEWNPSCWMQLQFAKISWRWVVHGQTRLTRCITVHVLIRHSLLRIFPSHESVLMRAGISYPRARMLSFNAIEAKPTPLTPSSA